MRDSTFRAYNNIVITAALLGLVLAGDPLQPAPLWGFNGRAWSGLRIGEQTDADLKKQFGAGKGAIRPEALQIPTGDDGIRVDALLDGRGGKAKLAAIRVKYERVRPPSGKELTETLGEEPEWYWHRQRASSWSMGIWPKSGIVVVGEEDGGDFRPDFFLLVPPTALWAMSQDYRREQTDLIDVPDPGRDWDRTFYFSSVSTSVTATGKTPPDCGPQDRKRMEEWADDELHRLRNSVLHYDSRARGSLSLSANWNNFNGKGEGKVNVSITYSGPTPYGQVSFSDTSTRTIRSGFRREFENEVSDVIDELIREGRRKADSLHPPTREEWYAWQMRLLYDKATGTNSAGTPLDGRKN